MSKIISIRLEYLVSYNFVYTNDYKQIKNAIKKCNGTFKNINYIQSNIQKRIEFWHQITHKGYLMPKFSPANKHLAIGLMSRMFSSGRPRFNPRSSYLSVYVPSNSGCYKYRTFV